MKIRNIVLGSAIATSLLMTSCSPFDQNPYFETDSYGNYEEDYENVNFEGGPEEATAQFNANAQNTFSNRPNQQRTTQRSNYGSDKLVMKPFMDKRSGMPFGYYPLPESWSIKEDGWYGPGGVKIVVYTVSSLNAQQTPYQSPHQLLNGRIGQEIKKAGGQILGTENLSSIAACDKAHRALHWNPGISKSFEAMGLEISNKGEKGYGIIKTEYYQSQYSSMWMYSLITLEAKPDYYEHAKKTLVYALSNFKPNMQQINNWNQKEQQRSNQSWANHNAKMRRNQMNFQTQNRALQNTYNEINDITMQTYKSQSASFDRSNQSITNGIYNENTVTNPYDGNSYQTDANYDRTFMNAYGEQIQTNDQFYSPDRDPYATGYQEVYPNGGGY